MFGSSGWAIQAWKTVGVALPQVTTDQVNAGTRIGLGEIQVGDMPFYDTGARRT
ncbi:hypothetical protein GCM10009642_20990 [Nocardiopsis metallicus]